MPMNEIRAKHYQELAEKLRATAANEPDEKRRNELLGLADQYQGLVAKLVTKIALTLPPDNNEPPTAA
jgi:hypothetical protein